LARPRSPDGKQGVFTGLRNGRADLYLKSAQGGGAEQLLVTSNSDKNADDWFREGRLIVFESVEWRRSTGLAARR